MLTLSRFKSTGISKTAVYVRTLGCMHWQTQLPASEGCEQREHYWHKMGLWNSPPLISKRFHSLSSIQPPLRCCQWQPSCSPADDIAMLLGATCKSVMHPSWLHNWISLLYQRNYEPLQHHVCTICKQLLKVGGQARSAALKVAAGCLQDLQQHMKQWIHTSLSSTLAKIIASDDNSSGMEKRKFECCTCHWKVSTNHTSSFQILILYKAWQ